MGLKIEFVLFFMGICLQTFVARLNNVDNSRHFQQQSKKNATLCISSTLLFCKDSVLITGLCFTFKQRYTDQIWSLSGHIGLPGSRRFPSLKISHTKKMHVPYYPLHFIWWPSGWSGGNRACCGIMDCSQVSWANPNVSPLPTHKGEE